MEKAWLRWMFEQLSTLPLCQVSPGTTLHAHTWWELCFTPSLNHDVFSNLNHDVFRLFSFAQHPLV